MEAWQLWPSTATESPEWWGGGKLICHPSNPFCSCGNEEDWRRVRLGFWEGISAHRSSSAGNALFCSTNGTEY